LLSIVVLEQAGTLAVEACAALLAALGARVVRVETEEDASDGGRAGPALRRLLYGGKERVRLAAGDGHSQTKLRELVAAADVVLVNAALDHDGTIWGSLIGEPPKDKIVCAISPRGTEEREVSAATRDVLIQAACGLMAVTGDSTERPEFARIPIAHLTAAVVALTSVLAALRVRDHDGAGQLIDVSLIEVMVDQLRTHVGLVGAGETRGFRIGCRHPLCSPWNVYNARDGWVMICSASDAQWDAILQQIGHADLRGNARLASAVGRRRNMDEVDALMQQWASGHTIDAVVAAMNSINVPVAPALQPHEVPNDALLIESGIVQRIPSALGETASAPRLAFRYSRTRLTGLAASNVCLSTDTVRNDDREAASKREASGPQANAASPVRFPLEGLRVVEVTRYAAGPLAGYILQSLGAEVIKIEPPGGEESRQWAPRYGHVSGYFANFNAGKRFACIDLKAPGGRKQLQELIGSADILLHNMRPGAMDVLGFGADKIASQFPFLIYCAISGFGMQAPKIAAFDTAIQARLGLTGLIGEGDRPIRVGYSIADQLAGHYAAAAVMGAVLERDRTGKGQIVDVAMADAIAWLTHLGWSPQNAPEPLAVIQYCAANGWVVAIGESQALEAAIGATEARTLTRADLVQRLAQGGIHAAAVLEVGEVLQQSVIRNRRSLFDVRTSSGSTAPLLVAPLGLTRAPVCRPQHVGETGDANSALFPTAGVPAA